MDVSKKLGILAGGGAAPRQVIEACQKAGRPFFVFCLKGQAEPDLADGLPHMEIALGEGALLKTKVFQEKIEEIVMIGHVRRPSLWEMKPDWLTFKILAKIGLNSLGDDGLLRSIGKAIEEECGVRMIGAHEVVEKFLMPEGLLTRAAPDEQAHIDIKRGVEVGRGLGLLDVGQSVIVQQGLVLGVEAIEGTDALLARAGTLRREGPGGVLVKLAKPQQDKRYDLPSIGPGTIASAQKAGLRGLALEAGKSIVISFEETVAAAEKAGLFILGIQPDER